MPYVHDGAARAGQSIRELGKAIAAARRGRAADAEDAERLAIAREGLAMRRAAAEADAAEADKINAERVARNTLTAIDIGDLGEVERAIGDKYAARRLYESIKHRTIGGIEYLMPDPDIVKEESDKRAQLDGHIRRAQATALSYTDPQEARAYLLQERARIEALVQEQSNRAFGDDLQDRIADGKFKYYGETEMNPEIQDRLQAIVQMTESGKVDQLAAYKLVEDIQKEITAESTKRMDREEVDKFILGELKNIATEKSIFHPDFTELLSMRAGYAHGGVTRQQLGAFFHRKKTGEESASSKEITYRRQLRQDAATLAQKNPEFTDMTEAEQYAAIDAAEKMLDIPFTQEGWERERDAANQRIQGISDFEMPAIGPPKKGPSRDPVQDWSPEQAESFKQAYRGIVAPGQNMGNAEVKERVRQLAESYGVEPKHLVPYLDELEGKGEYAEPEKGGRNSIESVPTKQREGVGELVKHLWKGGATYEEIAQAVSEEFGIDFETTRPYFRAWGGKKMEQELKARKGAKPQRPGIGGAIKDWFLDEEDETEDPGAEE